MGASVMGDRFLKRIGVRSLRAAGDLFPKHTDLDHQVVQAALYIFQTVGLLRPLNLFVFDAVFGHFPHESRINASNNVGFIPTVAARPG